ncbi:hypothetical protein CC80DRAFT_259196 [Byssothecium circinans]|uniref:Uncharacterized protein n=1 Tax=Byssothecium circinans TaxID=147558 RepID=A0A6A5U984_9PLEO|nr:hypothetical protein CC80DRAFT_259196 [Byssothecium circinans]
MATDTQAEPARASFMGIPLEIRHMIFAEASVRDNVKTKHVLRHWFERKDVKEQITNMAAADPTAPVPRGVYNPVSDEESEDGVQDEPGEEDEDGDGEEDEDGQGEDDQGENNEDEDNQEEDNEGEEDDAEMEDNEAEGTTGAVQFLDTTGDEDMDGQDVTAAQTTLDSLASAFVDDEVEDEHAGEAENDEAGEDMAENDENAAPETAPAPAAPIVQPHRKWRHVSKFLRITQCPPPVNLFLLNKELNRETKAWFYNVAILKVDATGSFGHYSFYQLALNDLAEAAFSPVENIKKAEITFVWDSTWIRAQAKIPDSTVAAVYPWMLDERAKFVLQILQQAPELEQVVIHWHDSSDDEEAQFLMNDICARFLELKANVKVESHLVASEVIPHRKSIIGRRRVEFQSLVDRQQEVF